ncbi:MAG: hypothetical protein ABFD91_13665 [Anaerohalosphaeraceae bacterium]
MAYKKDKVIFFCTALILLPAIIVLFISLRGNRYNNRQTIPDSPAKQAWEARRASFETKISDLYNIMSDKEPDCELLLGYRFTRFPIDQIELENRGVFGVKARDIEEEAYAIILRTDPNNPLVWYARSTAACREYIENQVWCLQEYQTGVSYSKKRNLDTYIATGIGRIDSIFLHYECAEHYGDIEISLERAKEILDDYLKKEYLTAREVILRGQQIDPDNAHYQYLLAGLYLARQDEVAAIEQFCLGKQKKLNTYYAEKLRMRAKLLDALHFTGDEKAYYLTPACRGDVEYEALSRLIWADSLIRYVQMYETKGDWAKVKTLYTLAIDISESFPDEERINRADQIDYLFKKRYH